MNANLTNQFAAVRQIVARYGAGSIDAQRAATLLAPAYRDAIAARAARDARTNDEDPDAASTPVAFNLVDVARQTGVISAQQYDALAAALVGQSPGQPAGQEG
jgi:hypothetical protein